MKKKQKKTPYYTTESNFLKWACTVSVITKKANWEGKCFTNLKRTLRLLVEERPVRCFE